MKLQREYTVGGAAAVAIFKEIATKGKGYAFIKSGCGEQAETAAETAVSALLEAGAREVFFKPSDEVMQQKTCKAGHLRFQYESSLLLLEAMLPGNARQSGNIGFEPLNGDNRNAFLEIYNRCFQQVPNSATYDEEDAYRLMADDRAFAAVVTVNGIPAGVTELSTAEETPSIEGIGLLPEYRGRGLGRALLRNVMFLFAQRGYSRASLIVSTLNKNALGLYLSEGFIQTRVISSWFRLQE